MNFVSKSLIDVQLNTIQTEEAFKNSSNEIKFSKFYNDCMQLFKLNDYASQHNEYSSLHTMHSHDLKEQF
jgi:hypothetical protein